MKALFFFFLFVFLSRIGTAQVPAGKASVRAAKSSFGTGDTLWVLANGLLQTTGACNGSLQWGLLQKRAASWDTLVDITSLTQLDCGLPTQQLHHDQIFLGIVGDARLHYGQHWKPGVYKLSFYDAAAKAVIYTPAFRIR